MELSQKDYITILKFYKIKTTGLKKDKIKEKAENILADKLCRCIKKVDVSGKDEPRAIAVCTKAVLHRKGVKANSFRCKEKARFIPNKKTKKVLTKIKKQNKNNTTRKSRKSK